MYSRGTLPSVRQGTISTEDRQPDLMADTDASASGTASTSDLIVELLNEASICTDTVDKVDCLRKVQEYVLFKEPNLLDNFLEEVIGFQKDRSQEVRKFLIGFIEEACKKDPETLPKVVANLQLFMTDDAVAVQKRVVQAMTNIYKVALKWLCVAKSISPSMEAVWTVISSIKELILCMLDADNDGIRTYAIKFMEMLILTQTHTEPDTFKKSSDLCLDHVPLTMKLARPRKLEEEALQVFDELIKYHGSAHISSANLMTCMAALSNLAKQRPTLFMAKVITTLEMLQANLPPTLSKSQVSSVRKNLKTQLLSLLKHPYAAEHFFTNITTLLTDLGALRDEVMKAMPKFEEMKRRAKKKHVDDSASASAMSSSSTTAVATSRVSMPGQTPSNKKAKIELEEEASDEDDEDDTANGVPSSTNRIESAVDITEKFIVERLNATMAAELVMRSISRLPADIPPLFYNTYTPIAAAGTEGQVRHVARLLAAQMTALKVGPGIEAAKNRELFQHQVRRPMEKYEDDPDPSSSVPQKVALLDSSKISTVIGGQTVADEQSTATKIKNEVVPPPHVTLLPAGLGSTRRSIKRNLKLTDVTQKMSPEECSHQIQKAVHRILKAERMATSSGLSQVRSKVIATLASRFQPDLKATLLNFIFEDIPKRIELAFSWLYQEYCSYQEFYGTSWNRRQDESEYNDTFCQLIRRVSSLPDCKERHHFLRRLYLESPIITEGGIDLLKHFVQIDMAALMVVDLMKDLVMFRPTKKLNFLNFLLEFCSHELSEVRQTAIKTVLELHAEGDFKDIIEDYSTMYLRFLMSPVPPSMLFGEDRGRPLVLDAWVEDTVKICLYLFLNLLPRNLSLFSHLADVFLNAKAVVADVTGGGKSASVKQIILRELDAPVSHISMRSNPALIQMIDSCPAGAEALITRIVHILTDKEWPPPELVDKMRDIYQTRQVDVRFLIPVLNGLSKKEILAAMPKLIQLSPGVVKEVFSRLLSGGTYSPADLLIVLHNIDVSSDKEAMKNVLNATKQCYQDKAVFSEDVMVIVLQQMLDQNPIPVLFMRAVIHTLTTFTKTMGFVLNILQRLIVKQVWKQKTAWDGFIKCCERTTPQSYAVMLQLPPNKLHDFLNAAPKLREPLLEHVQSFNEAQRAHISVATMQVLYNVKRDP